MHVWFSLIFTYLPFYFDLSFPVFFHSSVLMHHDPAHRPRQPGHRGKQPAPLREGGALTPTTSSVPPQLLSQLVRTRRVSFRWYQGHRQWSQQSTNPQEAVFFSQEWRKWKAAAFLRTLFLFRNGRQEC